MQAVKLTIPAAPQAAELAASYTTTHAAVDQYITNTHNEWFHTMMSDIAHCLDAPILLQACSAAHLIMQVQITQVPCPMQDMTSACVRVASVPSIQSTSPEGYCPACTAPPCMPALCRWRCSML